MREVYDEIQKKTEVPYKMDFLLLPGNKKKGSTKPSPFGSQEVYS